MERVHKYMARCGVGSRRACEAMIAGGKVAINGKTVEEPGAMVDPGKDRVAVEGRVIKTPENKVYFMLNKPRGFISTASDPRNRKKVTDLISGVRERLYPVGRLDADSEGLLILTNDGELTYKMTHPAHQVYKTYRVSVSGFPKKEALERLSAGVMLEDGMTAPAGVELLEGSEARSVLEITIREGKKRQVRRMCETVGHPVLCLKRTRIGSLSLGNLKPGQYRPLKASELKSLKGMAEGKKPNNY